MAVDPSRAKSLFLNASDLADPAERAAYLDRECGADADLRNRVEALLRANEDFLAPLPAAEGATIDSSSGGSATGVTGVDASSPGLDPAPVSTTAEYRGNPAPDVLIAGRYTLQEKIGEGGMGEVWVAKQSKPVKRKMALKLIKQGMDSRAVLQRFEQERQALAMMDHPNIAKVFDAGLTPNGQPFFVMELVNGLPLNKFCDEARLTTKDRLELFVTICQAVQHAHQKGIVHRDLKPANILITLIDGKPLPKVIDFGVAKATAGKLTDESMSTQFGAVVGTLEYMSPEQAGFSGEDIDTRADIYSLGVILYELLTGLRPLDAARLRKAALTEMMRIIREEEPSKPSTRLSTDASLPSLAALRQTDPRKLMNILRGELDWVVMKCLEKHRERRYETANALARDIQRYLADEAVEARPPSAGYRFQKFALRHKGQVIAASLVLLALVSGIIGTSIGLVRADRARRAEVTQRRRAEQREQQAIDAVKRFGDAVAGSEALKNDPSLVLLRKTLLKEPLEFFKALREQLQAEHDTRPESLKRLAGAAFDLGKLTSEIGDKRDALIAYQESLAIAQKLADADPAVTEFQSNLAGSHYNIGILLSQTGKPVEALGSFKSALEIWQKLADANPAITEFQSDLAAGLNSIGLLLSDTGKPAEALEPHRSALAILRKLADANPAVTDYPRDLAASHNNIGRLLRDTGKPAEALESFKTALAIRQKLADANPAVAGFQFNLAGSHHNVGLVLSDTGKPAEALESHRSALAIRRKLADADPAVTAFQRDLAVSQNSIGILLSDTGKPAEALGSFKSALLIQRKLADANPAVTAFQRDLAGSHNNIGRLLRDTGEPAEALESYKSALAIQRKLAKEHPEMPGFASALGATLDNMATLDLDAKRYGEARVRLREAVDWQRKALAASPANPTYRQFLAGHLKNLIDAPRGLSDAESLAEAERELAKLRDSDPAMAAVDARLSDIIKGDRQPKDTAERLRLAQRAYDKGVYATAARLWAEAIAADPKLGDDRQAQHRYNAACSAALAGSGQGKDDPKPDDAARAKLRQQALDWLKAELTVWSRLVESDPPAKPFIAQTLKHWQEDADLAAIRDEKELAKFPEAERKAWHGLWADVDACATRVEKPSS